MDLIEVLKQGRYKCEITQTQEQIEEQCERHRQCEERETQNDKTELYNSKIKFDKEIDDEKRKVLAEKIKALEHKIKSKKVYTFDDWKNLKERKVASLWKARMPQKIKEFDQLIQSYEVHLSAFLPKCHFINEVKRYENEIASWIWSCCHYIIFDQKLVKFDEFAKLFCSASWSYMFFKTYLYKVNREYDEALKESNFKETEGLAAKVGEKIRIIKLRMSYLMDVILTSYPSGDAELPKE